MSQRVPKKRNLSIPSSNDNQTSSGNYSWDLLTADEVRELFTSPSTSHTVASNGSTALVHTTNDSTKVNGGAVPLYPHSRVSNLPIRSKWVVLKFGGSSMGSSSSVNQVISVIRHYVSIANNNVIDVNNANDLPPSSKKRKRDHADPSTTTAYLHSEDNNESAFLTKPSFTRIAIVVSAPGNTTDFLIDAANAAQKGNYAKAGKFVDHVCDLALGIVFGVIGQFSSDVKKSIDKFFDPLRQLLQGISLLREMTPSILDLVLSFGERLSAMMLTCIFQLKGIPAIGIDARVWVKTDETYGGANVNWSLTKHNARRLMNLPSQSLVRIREIGHLLLSEFNFRKRMVNENSTEVMNGTSNGHHNGVPEINHVPSFPNAKTMKTPGFLCGKLLTIHTGFIGSSQGNRTTTLGRNGSDYTAALLGSALGAEKVIINTDVSGVYTADPRIVKDAYPVKALTYTEALELAMYGSRMFHSKTFAPLIKENVPMLIKNTRNMKAPGTVIISSEKKATIMNMNNKAGSPVVLSSATTTTTTSKSIICQQSSSFGGGRLLPTCVSSLENQVLVLLRSHNIEAASPTTAARILLALGDAGVQIHMGHVGSSGQTLTLLIPEQQFDNKANAVILATLASAGLRYQVVKESFSETTGKIATEIHSSPSPPQTPLVLVDNSSNSGSGDILNSGSGDILSSDDDDQDMKTEEPGVRENSETGEGVTTEATETDSGGDGNKEEKKKKNRVHINTPGVDWTLKFRRHVSMVSLVGEGISMKSSSLGKPTGGAVMGVGSGGVDGNSLSGSAGSSRLTNMHSVRLASRFFNALQGVGVEILAVGDGQHSVSCVVDQSSVSKAVTAVHSACNLSIQVVHLIILCGRGGWNMDVTAQLTLKLRELFNKLGEKIQVRVLCQAVSTKDGEVKENAFTTEISYPAHQTAEDPSFLKLRKKCQNIMARFTIKNGNSQFGANENGGKGGSGGSSLPQIHYCKKSFADLLATDDILESFSYLSTPILLDCSGDSGCDRERLYNDCLNLGIHVIVTNAKSIYDLGRYFPLGKVSSVSSLGVSFSVDSTVGSSLPILEQLRSIRRTGDTLQNLECTLSGTLSFIYTTMFRNLVGSNAPASNAFTSALIEAYFKGYTEENVWDDLSGADVHRKSLVLARQLGIHLDPLKFPTLQKTTTSNSSPSGKQTLTSNDSTETSSTVTSTNNISILPPLLSLREIRDMQELMATCTERDPTLLPAWQKLYNTDKAASKELNVDLTGLSPRTKSKIESATWPQFLYVCKLKYALKKHQIDERLTPIVKAARAKKLVLRYWVSFNLNGNSGGNLSATAAQSAMAAKIGNYSIPLPHVDGKAVNGQPETPVIHNGKAASTECHVSIRPIFVDPEHVAHRLQNTEILGGEEGCAAVLNDILKVSQRAIGRTINL
eukprot:g3040.t1